MPVHNKPALSRTLHPFLFLCGAIMLVTALYWPGLAGPFMFDDMPNLSALGNHSWLENWKRLVIFLLTGDSGPTGRPIALASFWLNDNGWPSNAYRFKYTNLMLHLLNGVLVFWFVYRLFSFRPKSSPLWVAAFTALLWMLHPLHVSTVLYVVQRMTELSATFTLAGLIAYLYIRPIMFHNPVRGYVLGTAAIGIFSLLAILSKENGVNLLIYILVTEYLFLGSSGNDTPVKIHQWTRLVLIVPLALLFGWLLYRTLSGDSYVFRDFTLYERLLTEARVLGDYMRQIILPSLSGGGPFHDDYIKSTSVITPPATLGAILLIIAGIVLIFYKPAHKTRLPFALAWFLGGHLLESSFLPLELYFEHRNYLPMLGLMIFFVHLVFNSSARLKKTRFALLCLYAVLLSTLLYAKSNLWQNTANTAMTWATENPTSSRAQEGASIALLIIGRPDLARQKILEIVKQHGHNGYAWVQWINFDCSVRGEVAADDFETIRDGFHSAKFSQGTLGAVKTTVDLALSKQCAGLDADRLLLLLDAYQTNPNPKSNQEKHFLNYFLGLAYTQKRQLNKAMQHLDLAYEMKPELDIRLYQISLLESAGLYQDALDYLRNLYQSPLNWKRRIIMYLRQPELQRLEKKLQSTINAKNREQFDRN